VRQRGAACAHSAHGPRWGGADAGLCRAARRSRRVDAAPRVSAAAPVTPRTAALGRGSTLGTSFNFLSNILSGGVLGVPFCFHRCGLGLGGALLAAVLATQVFTLRLLLYASRLRDRATYEDLAEDALGRAARPACLACVLSLQFGCLVAYLAILADLVSATVSPIIPPGAEVGRSEYMGIIVVGVLLPLCLLVRSEEAMSRTSIFSVVFLCGFTAATLCIATVPEPGAVMAPLAWWRPQGLTLALPVLVFALTGHSAFFPCIATMRSPSLRRVDGMLGGTMRAAGCVYAAVGMAGYAAFREHTAGNLLRNFSMMAQLAGPRAAAVRHLKLGFAFSVAGAVPVTLLPVRDAMLSAIGGEAGTPPSQLQHALITALILCITLVLAVLVPNVELVFALTGATASVMLAYIFPAAMFLSLQRDLGALPEVREKHAARVVKDDDLWARQEAVDEIEAVHAVAEAAARSEEDLFGCFAGTPARVLCVLLIFFGAASMWLCTLAALRAVSEEAAVVAVAQSLVIKSESAITAAQALGKAAQAACTLTGLAAATADAAAAASSGCQSKAAATPVGPQLLVRDASPVASGANADYDAAEELVLAVEQAEEAARRGGVRADVLQAAAVAAHAVTESATNTSAAAGVALATAGAVADAALVAVRDAVAALDPTLAARAKELALALGSAEHVEAALAIAQEQEPLIAQYKAETAAADAAAAEHAPTYPTYTWGDAAELWDDGDAAAAASLLFGQGAGAMHHTAQPHAATAATNASSSAAGTATHNATSGAFGDLLLTRLSAGNHTAGNASHHAALGAL
jgi:amino acid permease